MTETICLCCKKFIEVDSPCFIQLCEDCKKEINWGGENGKERD